MPFSLQETYYAIEQYKEFMIATGIKSIKTLWDKHNMY